jgi:hypothetical protein
MTDTLRTAGWRLPLWIALALGCGLLAFEVRWRGIDPDEFEHLHAGYLVFRGEVPYRDYFEHHGPLLYYVVQPLFQICGPELTVLWWARGAMWLCSLGTLWLTAVIARRAGDAPTPLIAATLLVWTTIFQAKGIELRPDVPATLLLTAAAAMIVERPAGFLRWLLVGLLAGLATLFTQKCIVPIAALTVAACLRECFAGAPCRIGTIVLAIAGGGGIVWGATYCAFASAGAADQFIRGTVTLLAAWPMRSSTAAYLRPTLAADATLWFAAAVEIASQLRTIGWRLAWKEGGMLLAVTACLCVASLPLAKATYPQFYLLWFPILAALAAQRLAVWCETEARTGTAVVAVLGSCLLIVQTALGWRALNLNQEGALPNLSAVLGQPALPAVLLPLGLSAAAAFTAVWFAVRYRWGAVVSVLAALGMFHGILRDIDRALWSNELQVAAVETLHRHVGPKGTVLDGFTGYGALRPHAYYYWWINDYSLALMDAEEREGRLLTNLQRMPPAAVLFDRHLERLPGSVTAWIRERYEPLDGDSWLWLPRESEQPAPASNNSPTGGR